MKLAEKVKIKLYLYASEESTWDWKVEDEQFLNLIEKLEASLDKGYIEDVKERTMRENGFSEKQFDCAFSELKKYFLLCSLYKYPSMYAKDADIVWHQMLMFTRDYEKFCHQFFGEMLHHSPTTKRHIGTGDPLATREWRLLFELVYQTIFKVEPHSHFMWGDIYGNFPENMDEIIEKRFNTTGIPESHLLKEKIKNKL